MPGKRAPGLRPRNIAIPDDVYAPARARAYAAGTTVSVVVNEALARYAAGDDRPTPAPRGGREYRDLEHGTGPYAGRFVLVRRLYDRDRDRARKPATLLAEEVLAEWTGPELFAFGLVMLSLLAPATEPPGAGPDHREWGTRPAHLAPGSDQG